MKFCAGWLVIWTRKRGVSVSKVNVAAGFWIFSILCVCASETTWPSWTQWWWQVRGVMARWSSPTANLAHRPHSHLRWQRNIWKTVTVSVCSVFGLVFLAGLIPVTFASSSTAAFDLSLKSEPRALVLKKHWDRREREGRQGRRGWVSVQMLMTGDKFFGVAGFVTVLFSACDWLAIECHYIVSQLWRLKRADCFLASRKSIQVA